MTLTSWIVSQSNGVKLAIGLTAGFLIYAFFRWFIWQVRKNLEEIEARGKKIKFKNRFDD
jgi:hypothetical protein